MEISKMQFIKVTFQCTNCENKSDIFFENRNGINEVFERLECRICKEIKVIGIGDLGYRTDMPNPDYPPWQAQFIRIKHEDALCLSCAGLLQITLDHSRLVTDCFVCKEINTMNVMKMITSSNKGLSILIKDFCYRIVTDLYENYLYN